MVQFTELHSIYIKGEFLMSQKLLNKVAVVTSANGGIGLSIAEHYLAERAKVIGFSRNTENLSAVSAKFPDNMVVVAGDVTKSVDIQQLVDTTVARFGKVDSWCPMLLFSKRSHLPTAPKR